MTDHAKRRKIKPDKRWRRWPSVKLGRRVGRTPLRDERLVSK